MSYYDWLEQASWIASVTLAALGTVFAAKSASKSSSKDAEDIRTHLPSGDASIQERHYALQREYHARGLAQSRQSFWFSILAASIGFLVIMSALFIRGFDSNQQTNFPTLQVVSGVVIEAVAALFFVQSNKARELMISFFDKLREDRKFEECLALARDLEEGETKQRLLASLSMSFSGSMSAEQITALIQQPAVTATDPSTNGHSAEVQAVKNSGSSSAKS